MVAVILIILRCKGVAFIAFRVVFSNKYVFLHVTEEVLDFQTTLTKTRSLFYSSVTGYSTEHVYSSCDTYDNDTIIIM